MLSELTSGHTVHYTKQRFINRAAMGRARFMFYPWFFFFFGSFVGDQTQTSLGQTSNDATYGVSSCKEYIENLWG